jgi:hypothetical protein
MCPGLSAQEFYRGGAVGGISVDAEGVLNNATVDATGKLREMAAKSLQAIPGELGETTELRKVSLRRLEKAIDELIQNDKPLPDEIRYLAGLQQIRYVFVYPEQQDIVLVGPAEPWKVGPNGTIVGTGTGRPVMLLDDLVVALRTARGAAKQTITCSIDPRQEGLVELRNYVRKIRTIRNPQQTIARIEQALGPQTISVNGVPDTSHFARVMVAADYRMKRLAMHFERPPVQELPSFLDMMKATGRGMKNLLPRWWLAPEYESVLRDPDGLAWELRGPAVKTMTEQDFLTAAGDREHTGRPSPVAQKWADNMTRKYDELAVADPIFGQLRNCMELAVVAALIVREDLPGKAGYSLPTLLDPTDVQVEKFPAPKQVSTQASVVKKGRNWLFSASGGVEINSWAIAGRAKESDTVAPVRTKSAAKDDNTNWWWN